MMQVGPDWSVVYAPSSRKILNRIPTVIWKKFNRYQRYQHLQEFSKQHCVEGNLFVAQGKSNFYRFHEVLPEMKSVIATFNRYGVDPWYAQSVLMIESPESGYGTY